MNLLRSLLKLWLKLECQMITSCSAALLIRQTEKGDQTIMASWPENLSVNKAMTQAAAEVIEKKRIHLEKAQSETDDLYLGQPIFVDDVFWGTIVLQIRKSSSKDMQAVVKILKWGMTWLQFLLYQNDIETTATTLTQHQDPGQLIGFLTATLKEKTLDETAITVVNFIASQFQFDRVSLGLARANKIHLTAVSFSATFDVRTQPMQNIVDAMQESLTQGLDIHLTNDAFVEPAPGLITRCHQHLLEEHRLAHTASYLLRRNSRLLGVLTIEQAKGNVIDNKTQSYIEKSLHLVAAILDLKLQAQLGLKQQFRSRFVDFLQRCFGPQHPVEKLIVAGALVFLIALFIPVTWHVAGDAVLQSTNKHLVVSPHEGFIGAVHVKPGDSIAQSQLLVSLKDEELKLERRRLSSQLQQYQLEYDNALASGDRAQAAILNAQVEQGRAELQLVEQKLERTRLKSPIEGVIISDDISQSLGAPVSQGEVLFEIADRESFFVQLFVNEKNIADVKPGQQGKLNLSSLPGEKFQFTIERITPLSELRDGKNYFRLDAKLISTTELLRPGMTGTGKITIEKRALGWIWFHDIWHWLRLTFWF